MPTTTAEALGQTHASVKTKKAVAPFDSDLSAARGEHIGIHASVEDPQSWRISAQERKRGRKGRGEGFSPYFEVRTADPGVRVHFCYYEPKEGSQGMRLRQPYCCYLSIEQWEGAKNLPFRKFSSVIIERIEERKAKPQADVAKLSQLVSTIERFSTLA